MDLGAPILAFTAAAAILTVTPGADTAMVLRSAALSGTRNAAATAIGIGLGCLVWGVGAALGLTTLLAASTAAFTVLKWAGGAYLLWLGVKLLINPRATLEPSYGSTAATSDAASFGRGFLTNMMNPKVGIFYITFLPQFIPSGVNVAAFSLALATIHVVMGLLWFGLLIALTAPIAALLAHPSVLRGLDRLTGIVFVGFGLKLAFFDRR